MKKRTAELHSELQKLAQKHRDVLAKLLDHLSELNRRKGFLEFGHPSLLKYCVKELGMSESAAYRKIKALKIVEKSPEVKKKLKEGNLNLSQISKAEELFRDYQHENDRKVPEYKKLQLLENVEGKDLHHSENSLRGHLGLPPKKRVISVHVNEETYQKWLEYKGRMAHKNMSDEMLLCFAIEKASRVEKPRRKVAPRPHNKDSRYIPAHIKRKTFEKAGYKCSWPGCGSVYGLEIDHITPVSQGGKTEEENLRLLCRHHNQSRNYH